MNDVVKKVLAGSRPPGGTDQSPGGLIAAGTRVYGVLRENRTIGGGNFLLVFEVLMGPHRGAQVRRYLWYTKTGKPWADKVMAKFDVAHARDLFADPVQVCVLGKVSVKTDQRTGEAYNEYDWLDVVPAERIN